LKKAVVGGAGGFIGTHLVKRLKRDGYWVRGVDIKKPEFGESPADEFLLLDLRLPESCERAVSLEGRDVEVYQLAADMGGMGRIHSAECEIMRNSALVNIHMIRAAAEAKTARYFFSSSVCVYRNMRPGEPEMAEDGAYPALPDNEYGWEKLYAERMSMAYGRRYGMDVRIARFQNCYGPQGTWRGGREKAPAALCRKVAVAPDGGTVEVWGDGRAVRSYTYIDDMVDGICRLTHSELEGPVNIGSPQYVTVDELAETIADAAGKKVRFQHVEGPVGVQSRNFSNERIYSIGWEAKFSLANGIALTYPWIESQVAEARSRGEPI